MQSVALPKKIEYKKSTKQNQAEVIIEPCFPGYGITLGNSIRRVLLSSLPGAAPIGVKIKNVDHEFSTLANLREDILEFVLNLKQLRLKVFSDEVIKLELDVHGEKEVKAGDIKKNSQVEIANPDLTLANITDMAGSLNAEIYVSRGMGYSTIESRENEEKEIGYIEIDSIFSPVISVGMEIVNVRVGKMTNWDKLILNITTDGALTPMEAFQQSVNILIDQYNSLIGKKEKTETKISEEAKEAKEEEKEGKGEEILDKEKITKKNKLDIETIDIKNAEEAQEKPKKKRGRPRKVDR